MSESVLSESSLQQRMSTMNLANLVEIDQIT